jgi:hypothetical protein
MQAATHSAATGPAIAWNPLSEKPAFDPEYPIPWLDFNQFS